MKPFYFFLPILLFANSYLLQGQENPLTREDAISVLLNEIIVPATLNHQLTAYLLKAPLNPGDRVEGFLGPPVRAITAATWFGWLDDTPGAFFAHPNRFVFIDVQSGKVDTVPGEWWPVLNGKDLFMSNEEWRDMDLIIYSDQHRR